MNGNKGFGFKQLTFSGDILPGPGPGLPFVAKFTGPDGQEEKLTSAEIQRRINRQRDAGARAPVQISTAQLQAALEAFPASDVPKKVGMQAAQKPHRSRSMWVSDAYKAGPSR